MPGPCAPFHLPVHLRNWQTKRSRVTCESDISDISCLQEWGFYVSQHEQRRGNNQCLQINRSLWHQRLSRKFQCLWNRNQVKRFRAMCTSKTSKDQPGTLLRNQVQAIIPVKSRCNVMFLDARQIVLHRFVSPSFEQRGNFQKLVFSSGQHCHSWPNNLLWDFVYFSVRHLGRTAGASIHVIDQFPKCTSHLIGLQVACLAMARLRRSRL